MLYAHEELLNKMRGIIGADTLAVIQNGMENQQIEEIRIRRSKRIQLIKAQCEVMLGEVADDLTCARLFESLCDHSVYSHAEEIKSGFISLKGGCRVGICGHAVSENNHISRITDINGFCIRVAREVKGCADEILPCLIENGRAVSTLIISAPGIGKTTMLRDIARQLSDGLGGAMPHKVCIADERGELAAVNDGEAWLDVGERTDILDMCPKTEAMELLIRSMSPQVIITDEIGAKRDADILCDAARCGISVIASLHADAVSDAVGRISACELMHSGCFKKCFRLYRNGGQVMFERVWW